MLRTYHHRLGFIIAYGWRGRKGSKPNPADRLDAANKKDTLRVRVFFVSILKNGQLLAFLIADIFGLSGIEGQVANGGNQAIDAKGNHGEEDVGAGSAGVSLRLEAGVIDNDAADPPQEERQKKAYQIFVIHFENSFI